ncbi:MAG: hotdog fold thioesterase, partial [Gammaproteobacteria bacterium]
MEQTRKLVAGAIAGSPFGQKLGIVCEEIERDRVRMRLPFRNDVTTVGDMVHGGAIAALVDTAATAAAWSNPDLPAGARGTTIGFSLSFLGAGRAQDLVATAEVVQRGKSICVCDVAVADQGGRAVASATVTYKLSGVEERAAVAPAEAMAKLFDGKTAAEQRALLAVLERAGAAIYRSWAEKEEDPKHREELLAAARREEENAQTLERGGRR